MERYEVTRKAGLFGIFGNIFLLIIKGTIGFLTNSQAMIADSANSAGDIFASAMTSIGNKIASEPQDDSHNFGHGKAEYIFSMFIGISMIVVAFKLLYDSVISLINQEQMQFSWILILVCIITITIKASLYLYTKKLSKKFDNILIEANMKDHRNDCIVTTFTLISILATLINIYWLDGLVGIGISIWIALTGLKIFIESYNVLMDKSIDEDTKDLILHIIKNYDKVQKVSHFYSTPVGYQYMIVLTISVDGNMSTFESHALADSLEQDITKLDKVYHTLIHVNPI
ncbi:MAG: cation diffusion facilitator family transporter [Clostridia bacterium]